MEHALPELRKEGPRTPARAFARRSASLTLVFQSFAIVGSGGASGSCRRLGRDVVPSSGLTAGAHFTGAGNQHRHAAERRPLKNRDGLFRLGGSVVTHAPSIGNRLVLTCSMRHNVEGVALWRARALRHTGAVS